MAAHESLSGDQFEFNPRDPIHIAAEAFRRSIETGDTKPRGSKSVISSVRLKDIKPIEPGNPDPDHTHIATYSYDAEHPREGKYTGNVSVGISATERKPGSRIWGHM